MRSVSRYPVSATSFFLLAAAAALAVGIFVFDTVTPFGMAVAVLYVVVVLIAGSLLQPRGVLLVSAACAVLTVLSYVLTHGGVNPVDSLVRCLMSLSAIGITTLLVVKNQGANSVLSEQAQLLDLTHDTIFVRDPRDVITYWNSAAEQLYGWTRSEAVGKVSHELMRTTFPVPLEDITAELMRTDRWEGELVHATRDGVKLTVASRWSLQRDPRGNPVAILETNNDITERKRAEAAMHKAQAELAHATRVATLGELAASIIHEVNQPLAAIVTNGDACVRLLGRQPPDLEEVRSAVEAMIRDGHRAGEVTRRLRALARKADLQKTSLHINEVVREVLRLVEREIRSHRVVVRTELAGGLSPVLGDRVQLQQVIINLIMNAIESMDAVDDRTRELAIRTEPNAGDHVVVAVRDSGIGYGPNEAERLFDAFFTTKRDGMGMGLAVCRSIIEVHGGRLWASRNAGPGATFQFRLPLQQASDRPT